MNKQKMLAVADAIEREVLEFDMTTWGVKTECGTAACVAGHACFLSETYGADYVGTRFAGVNDHINMTHSVFGAAQEELELTRHEAEELFRCSRFKGSYIVPKLDIWGSNAEAFDYINEHRDLVPDAIRWMVLNERVDWERAFNAVACAREKSLEDA